MALTETAPKAAAPARTKGPIVWMDMDQTELDNAYDSAPASLKNSLSSWVTSLKNASGSALRSAEEGPP